MMMSIFGKVRLEYAIFQKYALISLGWLVRQCFNSWWNSVKCLSGVFALRGWDTMVANCFHFFMGSSIPCIGGSILFWGGNAVFAAA
jgi:hypothetical protein